eukprot:gnl/Dysnectes_brevis/5715_a8386_459.p1 GENE.gnl/Dysnectes_brevis/5715_a8386_459~~gnl/Dysnectes_brevis/5715_a8386_459.p1  ORF type:complete len:168 (-),score=13.53 gnl/Dysnectes_brevis/5715_a8386_459:96-599(-)
MTSNSYILEGFKLTSDIQICFKQTDLRQQRFDRLKKANREKYYQNLISQPVPSSAFIDISQERDSGSAQTSFDIVPEPVIFETLFPDKSLRFSPFKRHIGELAMSEPVHRVFGRLIESTPDETPRDPLPEEFLPEEDGLISHVQQGVGGIGAPAGGTVTPSASDKGR